MFVFCDLIGFKWVSLRICRKQRVVETINGLNFPSFWLPKKQQQRLLILQRPLQAVCTSSEATVTQSASTTRLTPVDHVSAPMGWSNASASPAPRHLALIQSRRTAAQPVKVRQQE